MKLKPFLLASAMHALFVPPAAADQTQYPLQLENCGHELRFEAAPARAVTIGQSTTEILYALGLGEQVVGTSVWFNPVLPEFEAVNAQVERLADNDPSFESVVAKRPELVTAMYEWHVGPEGIVASREMFHDLGVATYVMPSDCASKDNSVGLDGTRSELFDTAQLYRGITELALIHDAQAQGAALLNDLRTREAAAIAKAESLDLPSDSTALFWFSSPEIASDPYVAGQQGVPAYMMAQLGLDNVVQSREEWPSVGWETLAKADPDFIILAEMERRRFPADSLEAKRQFLETDPVTREMTAVREGRILAMQAHAMDPSIRAIYALEKLADDLAGFDLTQ
ncbi:ABC transporter substrate-binding protein [Sulfitobacter aestuarii]|uniref:ABC transporter substrate-binding protein n=1 Tax=Sulfitobacter aestuarii TaxID=2161676 RepID=A0ABW5TZ54_9RHOB